MSDLRPGRKVMREILLKDRPAVPESKSFPSDPTWARLTAMGTSLWLDTGDQEAAQALWAGEMEALTTNNSLLNAEIQKGLYDEEVPRVAQAIRAAEPGMNEPELIREVGLYLNARHGLKLVDTFGAKVSVELHTDLAEVLEETVATGLFLYNLCPTHFIVKIPFTPAGVLATRRLGRAGVPINHTLGFSARENLVVAAIGRPAFVNVFMGRLGAYVAASHMGDGAMVGEKVTAATQRMVAELREKGWPTRLIGASIRDGAQLATLAGLDVYTMPPKAAAGFHQDPPAELVHCLEKEYPLGVADSLDQTAAGLTGLWELDEDFRKGVMLIAARVNDDWTPAELVEALAEVGGGPIFPAWTEGELEVLGREGKAPLCASWAPEIATGTKGLDALFTRAGLIAFSKDQAALDARVKGLLG